jgi:mRNA interferase MazF
VGVRRFDVYLVELGPSSSGDVKQTRPCLVISPDELTRNIRTVILAPMPTRAGAYPTRIECIFDDREALIVLDQLRTVDQQHLLKRLGTIDQHTQHAVLDALAELFAE